MLAAATGLTVGATVDACFTAVDALATFGSERERFGSERERAGNVLLVCEATLLKSPADNVREAGVNK